MANQVVGWTSQTGDCRSITRLRFLVCCLLVVVMWCFLTKKRIEVSKKLSGVNVVLSEKPGPPAGSVACWQPAAAYVCGAQRTTRNGTHYIDLPGVKWGRLLFRALFSRNQDQVRRWIRTEL